MALLYSYFYSPKKEIKCLRYPHNNEIVPSILAGSVGSSL